MLDRLLPRVGALLSPRGAFYLVTVKENDPAEICALLRKDGLVATVRALRSAPVRCELMDGARTWQALASTRAGREQLEITRFHRPRAE